MKSKYFFSALACVTLSVAVLCGGALFVRNVVLQKRIQNWCMNTVEVLGSTQSSPPKGVSKEEWSFLIEWTGVGIPNCFCNVDYVIDKDHFNVFQKTLDERLKGKIDENTIDWIWDEMESNSTIGKNGYVDRYRPTGEAFKKGLKAHRAVQNDN